MASSMLKQIRSQLSAASTSDTAKKSGIASFAMIGGVGLDQLLEKKLFLCPCVNYRAYGAVFMVVPAVIIGLLAFLTSKFYVDGFQGCHRSNAPKKVLLRQFVKIFALSAACSLVYVAVCFLRYQYYVCLVLGPKPPKNLTCVQPSVQPTKNPDVNKFDRVTAQSQIIGWLFIAGLVGLAFLVVAVRLCFFTDPNHDPDFPDRSKYERLEAMAAAKMYSEKMKELAEDEGAAKVELLFGERKYKLRQDPVSFVADIRKKMLEKYPRGTGDLSKPFRDKSGRHFSAVRHLLNDDEQEAIQMEETATVDDPTPADTPDVDNHTLLPDAMA